MEPEWRAEQCDGVHDGGVAALVDGVEPGPVYYDTGSGSHIHSSTRWSDYDGKYRRPRATHLRGGCACGWRGRRLEELRWEPDEDEPGEVYPAEVSTADARAEWREHLAEVEAATVPVPEDVVQAVEELRQRLDRLVGDAPLAGLKALAHVERELRDARQCAAYNVQADEEIGGWAAIARGLGVDEATAKSRVWRYERN